MKKKPRYKTAPPEIAAAIEAAEVIPDFLPPPEDLIPKEHNVRITIALHKKSIDFFRTKARRLGVPYQTMIKRVLDLYVDHYGIKTKRKKSWPTGA